MATRKKTEKKTDAISFLKSQHREVEELFARFEGLGERATKSKAAVAATIVEKLEGHAAIEETLLYPEGKPADEDLTLEAYVEHDVTKHLIAQIKATDPADETLAAKVTVLKEIVEHHVKEEEGELFPKIRKELGAERLEELGEELQAAFEAFEERWSNVVRMAPRRVASRLR